MMNKLENDVLDYIHEIRPTFKQLKNQFNFTKMGSTKILNKMLIKLTRDQLISWYINELGQTIYHCIKHE